MATEDDVTIDDIMEELYVRRRIGEGLPQVDAGEVISHEDVKKRLSRSLMSQGTDSSFKMNSNY